MKTVTFTVEITTKLENDVDPNDVCFHLDCGAHPPYSIQEGHNVGCTTAFTTTEHYVEDEYV